MSTPTTPAAVVDTKPNAVADERTPPALPAGKTMVGMWDDEMRSPRLAALLYLGVLFGSLLASHIAAIWSTAP